MRPENTRKAGTTAFSEGTKWEHWPDMGQSIHQRCSVKEVFLKMLQISQENACVGVPFK